MKRTKKLLLSLLLILVTLSTISASITDSNRQKIVSIDSPIMRAMRSLYISTGLALPSTTGPWSMAELDMMAKRIDTDKLSANEMVTYNYLMNEIEKSPRSEPKRAEGIFGFTISGGLALEAYYHTDPEHFGLDTYGFSKAVGSYTVPSPILAIPLETWFGNNIYGFSSFDLGINRTLIESEAQNSSNFLTNILMVPPVVLNDLNLNFPYRAFGSIGGDWWNISIGRDQLRWGPGESGNLTIGDQLQYHNNLRFTAFSSVFKYTFSISSFVHPQNYLTEDGTSLDLAYEQGDVRDGMKMFIAHRLEWRIVDKINMALTESIIYQSATNQFDFLVLSPTAIFHNFYIRANANSLLSLELDFTPFDHWNIYGEAVVDEFKLPGEFTHYGPPSAYGFIAGIKTAYQAGKGMLYASLEGAYTDPFLYLRYDGVNSDQVDKYGINFIVANTDFNNGGDSYYDLEYLGYRYGNDSAVANLNIGYEIYGKWDLNFDFIYWMDGTMDKNSKWHKTYSSGPDYDDPTTPTESPYESGTHDSTDTNYSSRNAIAHWMIATVKTSFTLFRGFDIYAQFRYINVLNFNNIKGDKASDIQASIGVSYSI